jgi:hypothetical protein
VPAVDKVTLTLYGVVTSDLRSVVPWNRSTLAIVPSVSPADALRTNDVPAENVVPDEGLVIETVGG